MYAWLVRIVLQSASQPASQAGWLAAHNTIDAEHYTMDILATLSSSCAPFTLSNLDQIVAFSPTDLQKGLQTLKDVQATIAAGLTIQDIQDRSQQDPPRHRRKRLQINADHISRHWASFKDWSAERLHRLLLCPTPDVEFVVGNNNGRKCLQSLIKGMPVSAEFLKILGTIVTTTAPLYESLKHMPDSQPQVANNYLSLAIPQKRNIALVAGSDIDIERKRMISLGFRYKVD